MNLYKMVTSDRIGPEMWATHWMLFGRMTGRFLVKKKLGSIGSNSFVRPYVTLCGAKNISIGNNVTIRYGSQLHASSMVHGSSITIEDDVLIAPNVFITVNNHKYSDINVAISNQGSIEKSILVKSGAWVAYGAVILPGVTIGRNSVVAAGAVVTKDVEDFTVVGGCPARTIKKIQAESC